MVVFCNNSVLLYVCIGTEIDGYSSNNHKTSSRVRRIENTNPLYEGAALYETMPGESYKSLLQTSPTNISTPDSTPHYVDHPPSLPPPRPDSNAAILAEPVDEIDAIKASFKKDSDLFDFQQQDGEYMIMGPTKSSSLTCGKTGSLKLSHTLTSKTSTLEREDCEEKYVTLDGLR